MKADPPIGIAGAANGERPPTPSGLEYGNEAAENGDWRDCMKP